jgi:hypothetical protein
MNDILQTVLAAVPPLAKVAASRNLADYYAEMTRGLAPLDMRLPDSRIMLAAIKREAARMYGDDRAAAIAACLQKAPIVESGTHAAILRDLDSPECGAEDSFRAHLNQNILISAMLARACGRSEHVSMQGSNVSLSHPSGAGYFQAGSDLFPTVRRLSDLGKCMAYDYPGAGEDAAGPLAETACRYIMLSRALKSPPVAEKIQNAGAARNVLDKLLHPLNRPDLSFPAAFAQIQKNAACVGNAKREYLERIVSAEKDAISAGFGASIDKVGEEFASARAAFANPADSDLADQALRHQSAFISEILAPAGISHTALDVVKVAKIFIIESMRDNGSALRRLFAGSARDFSSGMAGTRAGWGAGASPFVAVRKSGQGIRFEKIGFSEIDHSPDYLADLLSKGAILPSTGMIMVSCLLADLMTHGGFFQSAYAPEFQAKLAATLNAAGMPAEAKRVRGIRTDMVLLSLAASRSGANPNRPASLGEISAMPDGERGLLLDAIPSASGLDSITIAADSMIQYLRRTDPAFVEAQIGKARARAAANFDLQIYAGIERWKKHR